METEELHGQDEQTGGGLLNYEWAAICGWEQPPGSGDLGGKGTGSLVCLVYLLSALSALEIPSP